MYLVMSTVPSTARRAHSQQARRSKSDFFGQLSLRRCFRRLTASDTPTGQVPPAPVRGAHEQQCRTDIDRHDCALTSRACHPPPEASRREAKSEGGAPRKVYERGTGLHPNPAMLLARYTTRGCGQDASTVCDLPLPPLPWRWILVARTAGIGNRRVSPVAVGPGEGPLPERTVAIQPWRRERVLMPLRRPRHRDDQAAAMG